jgi:PRTRC genetic system protein E
MFSAVQALAQKTTLLIVVSAEGELLRVNVTPTSTGKDAGQLLHPISLLATPAELDAGFVEALNAWQAPRRSLIEQVEAAAAASEENDGKTKKPATTKATKPLTAKQAAKADKTAKSQSEPETAEDGAQSTAPGNAALTEPTSSAPAEPSATTSPAEVSTSTTQSAEPIASPPRAADSNAMPPDAPGDPVAPEEPTSGPAIDKFTIDLF